MLQSCATYEGNLTNNHDKKLTRPDPLTLFCFHRFIRFASVRVRARPRGENPGSAHAGAEVPAIQWRGTRRRKWKSRLQRRVWSREYGMGHSNTPATKFRLGSITKQFTATVILQLVEQGKIKLDAEFRTTCRSIEKTLATR